MIDDVGSDLTEGSTLTREQLNELKELKEYKRKCEELQGIVDKHGEKQIKRARRVKEKKQRVRIKDIKTENYLQPTVKYQLARMTKQVIWRSIKFWHADLEKKQ